MVVRKIGKLLDGTPVYPLAKRCYWTYGRMRWYAASVRASGSLFDQSGFYHVTPSQDGLGSFYIWLPDAKSQFRRECINGNLEPPVMEVLASYLDDETTFWDIGALRGYFAFACASTAENVVAFEASEQNVEALTRGKERNGFDNLRIQSGFVGEDVFLDDFAPPDLVLLDVEGWEYEILNTAPETLASHPRWIVEIHGGPEVTDGETPLPPTIDPEGVIDLFESNGYDITTITEWSTDPERRHILAEKSNLG